MFFQRKRLRLKSFNYSQVGCYFITICTKDRINYFGEISIDKMNLNELGRIAFRCWEEIPDHFDYIILDEFIVMPNHVHGIIAVVGTHICVPYRIKQK